MATPVWEQKSKEAIRSFVRKTTKPLNALLERDAVEGDTRTFVTDLLVDGLGYDKYVDLTAEYMVRGEFADIGIRIDKQIVAFVEIKRVSLNLKEQHLRQVKTYAANEGVEWAILTNGRVWQVYRISNTTPITEHLILSVDLLDERTPAAKADELWLLSREALKRGLLAEKWKAESVLAEDYLENALMSESVLKALRAEIRRNSQQLVDPANLKSALAKILAK